MITTVWAAAESLAAADAVNVADRTLAAIQKLAIPLILIATLGSLLLRWGTKQLTATSAAGTVGIGALLAGGIWMLPTLTQSVTVVAGQTTSSETPDPTATSSPPQTPTATTTPPPTDAAPAQPPDWTWVAQAAVVIAIVVVVAVIGLLLWLGLSRHRASRRAATQARTAQLQRWANGVTALENTSTNLMEFEFDTESAYFTRPLLADVNEPQTGAFYAAYAEAQALHTESVPTDDDQINAFVTAAAAAARAFGLADENARRKARIGVIHDGRRLTGDEKRKVDQARKLIAQAMDPATPPDNAKNAHAKAHEILDQVGLVIPERLTAKAIRSIEALHKPALETAAARAAAESAHDPARR